MGALAVLVLLAAGCRPSAPEQPEQPAPAASAEELRPGFEAHFDAWDAEGAFVLYDLRQDRYLRYNPGRCATRYLPASTFKIFNALVALETGVLADAEVVIPWDGVERGYDAWNRDHNLRTAFGVSAVWFYQEVARRVGAERMRAFVAQERYGNADIGGGIDRFWLDGALRISADEQVAFLRRLYEGNLPAFSPGTVATVKDIMKMEEGDGYTLRGKTGWAVYEGVNYGWLVGYVEKGDDVFFFAMQLESPDPDFDMVAARNAITYGILAELGIREMAPG